MERDDLRQVLKGLWNKKKKIEEQRVRVARTINRLSRQALDEAP